MSRLSNAKDRGEEIILTIAETRVFNEPPHQLGRRPSRMVITELWLRTKRVSTAVEPRDTVHRHTDRPVHFASYSHPVYDAPEDPGNHETGVSVAKLLLATAASRPSRPA